MFDLRPVDREVEIRIVRLLVALHTAHWGSHEPVTFAGIARVLAARPVAFFTLDVGQLRRRIQRLETSLLISDDVAAHAFVVELFVLFLKRRHGVGVPGAVPNLGLLLMATGAGLLPNVWRLGRRKQA